MKRVATLCTICALLLTAPAFGSRQSPVDGGTITSGPGLRLDPFGSGRMVMHNGWDIAVPVGTPVYPTQDGTVYFAGPYKGYGNLVAIQHGKGVVSLYGHNSAILVKAGDQVTCTTVIALSGSTGRSTGPHVHYELRQLPGSHQHRQEQLTASLKNVVKGHIDQWVQDAVTGKGGPETTELYLPTDIGE